MVRRPRLVECMERGADSKLTLISAPPGFGKTSLLAEWLAAAAESGRDIAWVSLDSNDNHAQTFWTYVFSALQRKRPGAGISGAIGMLQSPQPPPIESLLTIVLNDVAAVSASVALVLDDYHVVESPQIHEGIAFLLDHLPPQMHLVIASRADPNVPLPRLRARGELTEIRAADLRFTPGEAAAFLNEAMALGLSAAEVVALESRTEGWIAALQLAALSLRGNDDAAGFISAFTGDDRYIVDYLVEEVLERQAAPVREFLLQTSVLDRLNASLCDAVTGQGSAKAMLEGLERGNVFVIPLDDKRQWYRYHHLFADVLQSHLAEEQPDLVPVLHGRASEWYANDGQPALAIRHALAANDLARAAGLVELEAETVVQNHRPDVLVEWLKPIPPEIVASMPVLSTYLGIALQGMGDLDGSAASLDNAERLLDGAAGSKGMTVVDKEGFESLPSRIALARGYLAIAAGDTARTAEEARRALELLAPGEHHWHGTCVALLALAHWKSGDLDAAQPFHADGLASFERSGETGLAITSAHTDAELLKARGRLNEAGERYEKSLQYAKRHGGAALRFAANLHFGLSELCCERNDLEGAAGHLRQAEEMGIFPPRTPYRHLLAQARLRRSHGDLAGALELLDQAEELYVRGAIPEVRPVAAWKIRMQLALGRLDDAVEWTRAQGLSADDDLRYQREYEHITLARVLFARFKHEADAEAGREAVGLLQRLREAAESGGRRGAVIEILALQALAQQALGDVPGGLENLERSLALAQPEGYVRTFLEEGTPMRDLLRNAVAGGVGGSYAGRLLAAFEEPAGNRTAPNAAIAGLAEQLTPREIEILRLVAAGMRNQEIADHLVISLPTVKRHIANVYGKLDAGHRTEAIRRANELGLL